MSKLSRLTFCLLACFTLLASASIAKADTVTISVTPTAGTGALTLTFNTATDTFNSQDGVETSFYAVGTDGLGSFTTTLAFYNAAFFTSLGQDPWDFAYEDRVSDQFLYSGAKLYSGTEASPTVLAGTYNLTVQQGPSDAQIKISLGSPVAITPEPSSLLLLVTGLTGVGLVLRRRLAL